MRACALARRRKHPLQLSIMAPYPAAFALVVDVSDEVSTLLVQKHCDEAVRANAMASDVEVMLIRRTQVVHGLQRHRGPVRQLERDERRCAKRTWLAELLMRSSGACALLRAATSSGSSVVCRTHASRTRACA